MVTDIIDTVIPTSIVKNIMELVVNASVWEGRKSIIWKELENYKELITEMLEKIRKEETFLTAGNLRKEKDERMVKQEAKMKHCKERKMMIDLIVGMKHGGSVT